MAKTALDKLWDTARVAADAFVIADVKLALTENTDPLERVRLMALLRTREATYGQAMRDYITALFLDRYATHAAWQQAQATPAEAE